VEDETMAESDRPRQVDLDEQVRHGPPPPARESEVGPDELRLLAEQVLAWLEREKHEHGGEGERLRRLLRDALTRAKED
jgi:hypothetical protein